MKINREAVGNRILGELRLRGAFGMANAIPRAILLDVINREARAFCEEDEWRKIKDFEFREIYRFLPICSCEDGLYIPSSREDLEAFRIYMRAKAIPLFERVKKVAEAYPELIPDGGQMTLGI